MKEVTVSKELFDRTFKEKCEWKDKYWKAYDELVEQDREIERLNNIIKEVRELLKNDYFEDGSFENEDKVFELLDKEVN